MKLNSLALTLNDYPGVLSAMIFTFGCNLKCPFCHNGLLVLNKQEESEKAHDILAFLKKRQNILKGVVISGGEPLMHPEVVELIKAIKGLNYKIKVDTNGTYPKTLEKLIKANLVDYVALDYKGMKSSLSTLCGLQADEVENYYKTWLTTLQVLKENTVAYELRTTVIKEYHTCESLHSMSEELYSVFKDIPLLWFIQNYQEKDGNLYHFNGEDIKLTPCNMERFKKVSKMKVPYKIR